jgi:NAD kinase
MTLAPRAVVVHRRTELEELVARHGTRQQAAFFLASRGRDLEEVEGRHAAQHEALDRVAAGIPMDWRRGQVERRDLSRFTFAPEDIVVAVGQDGLVANVAKYLDGQPVVGINPEPGRNPGVLVPHPAEAIRALLDMAAGPRRGMHVQQRAMVQASLDDGQVLLALNEIYLGHPSHQSARYRLTAPGGPTERQSSSGVLVGTGTGATGWCRSVWQERNSSLALPGPEEPALCWFVREAWPSPATGTACTEGALGSTEQLWVRAESDLVIFGDGIEADAVAMTWGQTAAVGLATRHLVLVV